MGNQIIGVVLITLSIAGVSLAILFKDLRKFYIKETILLYNRFKIYRYNYGDLIITLLASLCIGISTYILYKFILLGFAYLLSSDLIQFFILNRGVFTLSGVPLQNPWLSQNIFYGAILTPIAQYFSIYVMITSVSLLMSRMNRLFKGEIYSSSSIVYFGTFACLVFLVIDITAFSQSISFVNLTTNIIVLVGAKLSYLLFFFSVLHIVLKKNDEYRLAIEQELIINKREKKLLSNNRLMICCIVLFSIMFFNFPLYSGFQFENKLSVLLFNLSMVLGIFYVILRLVFLKGFNFIGIYLLDTNKQYSITHQPKTSSIHARNISRLSVALVLLAFIMFNFRGLVFFGLYTFVFLFLTYLIIYTTYIIASFLGNKKENLKIPSRILGSLRLVLMPTYLFVFIVFALISVCPKPIDVRKYSEYQAAIIDDQGNLLFKAKSEHENPSIGISYKELPSFFVKSLLLKEDRSFLNQNSFWFNRANWHGTSINFLGGRGGSNLNQQLLKNLAFDKVFPQEIQRKYSEFVTSYQLSFNLSPYEILTHYVNNVSFSGGKGHKGIVNGSYHTFGRNIGQLNELEMLYLNFTLHRGSTFKISDELYVPYEEAFFYKEEIKLKLLQYAMQWQKDELISKKEFAKLKSSQLDFREPELISSQGDQDVYVIRPYKVKNVAATNIFFQHQLKALEVKDQVVKTTMNLKDLKSTYQTVNLFLDAYDKSSQYTLNAAVLVSNIKTGEVLSHYGGETVSDLASFVSGYPMASLIKPFVYAEMLDKNIPTSLSGQKRKGHPTLNQRTKSNIYENKLLSMSYVLQKSKNPPFRNLKDRTEPIPLFTAIEKRFSRIGIREDPDINLEDTSKAKENVLNYPLGSRRMTLVNIAQLYQALLNNGKYIKLHVGKEIYQPHSIAAKQMKFKYHRVYNAKHASEINLALAKVFQKGGTGEGLISKLPKGIAYYGKTGTSDKARHGYTVLCDGDIMVVAWVSYGKQDGQNLELGKQSIPCQSGSYSAGTLAAKVYSTLN